MADTNGDPYRHQSDWGTDYNADTYAWVGTANPPYDCIEEPQLLRQLGSMRVHAMVLSTHARR